MASLTLEGYNNGFSWKITGLGNSFNTDYYIAAGITKYQFTQEASSISGIVSSVDATSSRTSKSTPTIDVDYRAGEYEFWAWCQAANGMYYPAGSGTVIITETETYTFYFDFQGGSGGTESVEVEVDTELPEIDNPSRDGYAFMGYFTEPNGKGVQYYDEYGGVRTYDGTYDYITLYAYWEKEYTITLDKQGGSGGTSSIYLRIGQNVRSRISIPSRDDYTFLGYFTQKQSEATDIIVQYYDADGLCVLENREWTTEYNITIYAHWRSITANFAWTYEKVKDKPFNLTADEWNALAAFVNSKRSKAYSFTVAVKDEPFTADIYNEMVDAIGAGTKVEPRVPVTADLMNELVTNANNM